MAKIQEKISANEVQDVDSAMKLEQTSDVRDQNLIIAFSVLFTNTFFHLYICILSIVIICVEIQAGRAGDVIAAKPCAAILQGYKWNAM